MSFQNFTDQVSQYVSNSPQFITKIVITLVLFLVLWLLRLLLIRIINRNITQTRQRYKWRKNISYLSGFLGLLVLGVVWFEGLKSVGTFLGLLSAGLAIALRDPVTDFAGWIFISLRSPFDVGDRIQIEEMRGDVIDIRIFKFTILEIGNWIHADQSTGRVVHIPNHKVFSEPLANYTSDFEFVWNELQVLLTFESDWKRAKKQLHELAEQHMEDFIEHAQKQVRRANKSYLVHYEYLTPIVYTDVKESGINLTIRHLCDPRRRRSVSEALWEDILEMVQDDDALDFAYPTMRVLADHRTPPPQGTKSEGDANNPTDEP